MFNFSVQFYAKKDQFFKKPKRVKPRKEITKPAQKIGKNDENYFARGSSRHHRPKVQRKRKKSENQPRNILASRSRTNQRRQQKVGYRIRKNSNSTKLSGGGTVTSRGSRNMNRVARQKPGGKVKHFYIKDKENSAKTPILKLDWGMINKVAKKAGVHSARSRLTPRIKTDNFIYNSISIKSI